MFFGNKTITAVDIGSYAIKAVKMRAGKNGLNIITAGSRILPEKAVNQGEIQDYAVVSRILKDVLEEINGSKYIITAVPGKNLIIRNMEMPLISEEELTEAIKWEADDYLPFPVEQAMFDYILLSKDEENMSVLLVAAERKTINGLVKIFDNIGLKPAVINAQPMALISLLKIQGLVDDTVALVDAGASGTRVIIGDGKNIYLSRNIDIGGNHFTETLMESRNLEFSEAEEYKRKEGLAADDQNDNSAGFTDLTTTGLVKTLSALADSLAGEISRSLEYYFMKYKDNDLDKIFFTGGCSRLKGLDRVISEETGVTVVSIDPFEYFDFETWGEGAPGFSVAVGLGASEVLGNEN
ncbi:type IV pilus assembly protein PilM [Halothermothrix orenii]|uniref:Tfp pilus assembly protein, ATPase PilM n=1 Tax=Halothermothrix orenii (strain H 168 / OCM 544 / DSM 9562) TaxID=373903 RepID=B8D2D5_HALOH|nr:type IV pilus assembly protein PilM [Halothermothrix orenii]ACL69362.1 Tfp pilus assembly protein, ATPase PilM [Halothermothrix orenii H 168]